MKILVTGGAGFIGSEYVRAALSGSLPGTTAIQITVLDSLSYSGNSGNLAPVADHSRFQFVHDDICDPVLVKATVPGHDVIVHFAAESHVDRSIGNATPFANYASRRALAWAWAKGCPRIWLDSTATLEERDSGERGQPVHE